MPPEQPYDLVITGGRVIDPGRGLDAAQDVAAVSPPSRTALIPQRPSGPSMRAAS